jgi:[protein-PII] uridylyltransferase
VVGRVHYDSYHVYTVDVHSVAAVDRLAGMVRGETVTARDAPEPWEPGLGLRLVTELTRPAVLFFATLLHDIGKDIGRSEHAERGAVLGRSVLERLGFEPGDVTDACALIANHLLMYHVATRRDLDDPETVAGFAAQVGSADALRHLYLLTLADLSTTSPTSMTWWKARMLEGLFVAADPVLRGQGPVEAERVARRRSAVLEMVRAWVGSDEREIAEALAFARAYLDSMPPRYLLANPASAVAAHVEIVHGHGAQAVSIGLVSSSRAGTAELCVVAADRPGLLAAITAVLSGHRLDVHSAEIHSRTIPGAGGSDEQTQAVDVFWVRDSAERPEGVAALLPRLERDLRAVLGGELAPHQVARVGRRSGRRGRAVPARVVLDDRTSPDHTLIEVVTHDRPGLLFTLADAMHRLGLVIALAKINTEGVRVIDAFYVRESTGKKVCLEERAGELKAALLDAMSTMDAHTEDA